MFLTCLDLIADPEPDYWTQAAPLVWCDPVFGRIVSPTGRRTNLASIPRLVQNLPFLDVDGISRRPAALHDYLYGSAFGHVKGKDFADRFLRAAMLAEGARPATAAAFYWGVRLFGADAWDEWPAQGGAG